LWCFVAALGRYAEPFELFAAYGIANVLAAIPVTQLGSGSSTQRRRPLLVSFGLPEHIATLGAQLAAGQRLVADPDRRHRLPDAAAAGAIATTVTGHVECLAMVRCLPTLAVAAAAAIPMLAPTMVSLG
jgi:hypothetical protein